MIDPVYSGTATLSLKSGPAGASFTPVTVAIINGLAVFDDLSLGQLSAGTHYVFQVSMAGLTSATSDPVDAVGPTAGVANYYPLPFDSSIRNDILDADFDGATTSVVTLSISLLNYEITAGELSLFDGASGQDDRHRRAGRLELGHRRRGTSRVFEVKATPRSRSYSRAWESKKVMRRMAGIDSINASVGGGVLIDGGTVSMTSVVLTNNVAAGAAGLAGANGSQGVGGAGTAGGPGGDGRGGGLYLASGSLTLNNVDLSNNTRSRRCGRPGRPGWLGRVVFKPRHGRERWRRRQRRLRPRGARSMSRAGR